MSYSVLSIPPFGKQLKRLAKKYTSLKIEFAKLIESLAEELDDQLKFVPE